MPNNLFHEAVHPHFGGNTGWRANHGTEVDPVPLWYRSPKHSHRIFRSSHRLIRAFPIEWPWRRAGAANLRDVGKGYPSDLWPKRPARSIRGETRSDSLLRPPASNLLRRPGTIRSLVYRAREDSLKFSRSLARSNIPLCKAFGHDADTGDKSLKRPIRPHRLAEGERI
jgi:hypothetical protein